MSTVAGARATQRDGDRVNARDRRRAELLDAADRAIRREGPDVSMEALAAEAGITKPVLYRHFGDRDGLLDALATRHAARLTAELAEALATERHPRHRIRTTIATYLGFLERDPQVHRFVTRTTRPSRSGQGALADALSVVREAVVGNVTRELDGAGLDPAPAATWGTGIVGMVQLVGERWLDERDVERDELVQRLTDLVWHGFRGIVTAAPRARGDLRDAADRDA